EERSDQRVSLSGVRRRTCKNSIFVPVGELRHRLARLRILRAGPPYGVVDVADRDDEKCAPPVRDAEQLLRGRDAIPLQRGYRRAEPVGQGAEIQPLGQTAMVESRRVVSADDQENGGGGR